MNTKTLLGKTASNGIPLSILRIVIHFQMKRMEFPTYQIFKCLTFLGSVFRKCAVRKAKQSRDERKSGGSEGTGRAKQNNAHAHN